MAENELLPRDYELRNARKWIWISIPLSLLAVYASSKGYIEVGEYRALPSEFLFTKGTWITIAGWSAIISFGFIHAGVYCLVEHMIREIPNDDELVRPTFE